MAEPTQIACEDYLARSITFRAVAKAFAVRTLKTISLLDASPVYEPVCGFARYESLVTLRRCRLQPSPPNLSCY